MATAVLASSAAAAFTVSAKTSAKVRHLETEFKLISSPQGFNCGANSVSFGPIPRQDVTKRVSKRRFGIVACAAPDSATDAEQQKLEAAYNSQAGQSGNSGQSGNNQLENDVSKSSGKTNLTLFSPSKINVFLRVTKKREDGYHDLASLFHVISLGDVIKFTVSPSKSNDSLTSNASGVPLDEKNLIIKALNLYRKQTGSQTYFWVHLDKRVPTGAGLGGGSGNAATALWAANELSGHLASVKDLQEWSGEIGSDIPVFFSKGAAYCTGRGEIVRDIPSPFDPSTPMVLIKPSEECSTPEVFKTFKLSDCSTADPEELLESVIKNGISQGLCINDLEAPAFQVLPTLKELKERIEAQSGGRYKAVFMSGSGSTIVGVGDVQPPAFLHDEEQYSAVFISEAYFLTRKDNEWYEQPKSANEE